MDMRKLQRANKKFECRATEVEVEAKKLKAKASTVGEVLEVSKLKQVELESAMEQLTSKNKDLTTVVYLCKFEVNALMKWVRILIIFRRLL